MKLKIGREIYNLDSEDEIIYRKLYDKWYLRKGSLELKISNRGRRIIWKK